MVAVVCELCALEAVTVGCCAIRTAGFQVLRIATRSRVLEVLCDEAGFWLAVLASPTCLNVFGSNEAKAPVAVVSSRNSS